MEPHKADQEQQVTEWVNEIGQAVGQVGQLEAWVAKQLDGTAGAAPEQACAEAAKQFLDSTPSDIGAWEHLLVTLAFHSGRTREQHGLNTCKSIIEHLVDRLHAEPHGEFNTPELTTLASAMTVVLAIEDRLQQDVEEAMRGICERFPEAIAEVAEHCQDMWKRRGQMSGRRGLFLWDMRRSEWRLAQDFKTYRPSE